MSVFNILESTAAVFLRTEKKDAFVGANACMLKNNALSHALTPTKHKKHHIQA
jgi:hypothetical protein